MSYAKKRARGSDNTAFNHFVVHTSNSNDVIGCHDFEVTYSPCHISPFKLSSLPPDSDFKFTVRPFLAAFCRGLKVLCHFASQVLSSSNPSTDTCESAFGIPYWSLTESFTSFVDSSSAWHHLAVTWTAEQGMTRIYRDGLLIREVHQFVISLLSQLDIFWRSICKDCLKPAVSF